MDEMQFLVDMMPWCRDECPFFQPDKNGGGKCHLDGEPCYYFETKRRGDCRYLKELDVNLRLKIE